MPSLDSLHEGDFGGRVMIKKNIYIYRLDDGLRQLWDLDRRGNQCIHVDAERAARGIYFGFQGVLNPVFADDSSSKMFILQQWGNQVDRHRTKLIDFTCNRSGR